ncbi:MAG: ExbD/TolR family protein [Planctomycetota bacterium]
MQFRRNSSSPRTVAIDMTPMIDIVFQLLIFFLVTAQMAEQTRAQLNLPKEAGEESKDAERAGLTVNLLADGSVVVDGATVTMEELDAAVDAAIARSGGADMLKPLVRADRDCDAARLNEVFSRLAGRGLAAIRLATEKGGG